jgi:hypothetical protein
MVPVRPRTSERAGQARNDHMPWANPFGKRIETVLDLTAPPEGTTIEGRAEAIAVGLLMRARVLLHAAALLMDRMLAGATDPTARAILETAFAAGSVLNTPGAELLYIGQHRKKWKTIAEEVQQRQKVLAEEGSATGGWVDLVTHPELAPFLEKDEEMPAHVELPSFEEMSRDGGFGEFYTIYRMITRRAHPNLDAARSRLSWNDETGVFAPVASLTAVELGDPYVELCIYVIAKLGMLVDERLGWGRAAGLHGILDDMTQGARSMLQEAETAADTDVYDEEGDGSAMS